MKTCKREKVDLSGVLLQLFDCSPAPLSSDKPRTDRAKTTNNTTTTSRAWSTRKRRAESTENNKESKRRKANAETQKHKARRCKTHCRLLSLFGLVRFFGERFRFLALLLLNILLSPPLLHRTPFLSSRGHREAMLGHGGAAPHHPVFRPSMEAMPQQAGLDSHNSMTALPLEGMQQSDDDSSSVLWAWYALIVVVSVINLVLLLAALVLIKTKQGDQYAVVMKLLAIPWVWDGAWRSVFPSLYLQRFVFWDTPLNAILVDRTWACLGELSWAYQIGYAIRQVDRDVTMTGGGKVWVQVSGWLLFLVYVVAECISYYNTATTNEFWAAMEVIVDGLSFLLAAPACVYLTLAMPGKVFGSSGKFFTTIMSVVCVVYPLYNIVIDAPMYFQRYAEDQAANKTYLPFVEGLVDAAVRRVPTHNLTDWSGDMGWMTAYFSVGSWTGILLMFGPRGKKKPATPVVTTVVVAHAVPSKPAARCSGSGRSAVAKLEMM